MHDNTTLARFADRFAVSAEPQVAEQDPEENAGALGYLRGTRERAHMLEFRLKHGGAVAYAYALLDKALFDPSNGIELSFAGRTVRITGQRLNEPTSSGKTLFESIVKHRVTWVREASRADLFDATADALVIESIIV